MKLVCWLLFFVVAEIAVVAVAVTPRHGGQTLMDLARHRGAPNEPPRTVVQPVSIIPLPPTNAPARLRAAALVVVPPSAARTLPGFSVGPGAETNFWVIQRGTSAGGPWVTIISNAVVTKEVIGSAGLRVPFYGRPSGSLTVTSTLPAGVFRLKGHL